MPKLADPPRLRSVEVSADSPARLESSGTVHLVKEIPPYFGAKTSAVVGIARELSAMGAGPPSQSACALDARVAALGRGESVSIPQGDSLTFPGGAVITNGYCETLRVAGAPASDKLSSGFSLVTCKRLVALVEQYNRYASKLHELRERLKACKKELALGVDADREKVLALEKYRDETEAKACKDSLKVTGVTVLELIMEAAGGTLFEAAEASKPAPGESPPLEPDSPAALYPYGATVLDHTGKEMAAVFPEDGVVVAGLTSTWWAWWRAGVPAWADEKEWKVGAMITLLDSVECQTPARYLRCAYRWFKGAADRKAAMEALPDVTPWFADGMHSVFVRLCSSANRGDLATLMAQMAQANLDAFIDWARGPESALNKLLLEFEQE